MAKSKEDHAPVFSIIMPVYNAEKYLKIALNSIQNQSFTDFELILVNDCSTDQSLAICTKYRNLDRRIVVIDSEKNGGAAEARNRGIETARGKYLCFVDADDYIDSDFLQQFYNALQKEDYDFVKCGAYEEYYDREETLRYSRQCVLQNKDCQGIKVIAEQAIDMEQIPLFGFIWNGVYKLDIVKAHNLKFDNTLKVNEDFAFNISYIPFIRIMKCLSYCGYHYAKRNSDSLSSGQKNYDYEKHMLKVRGFLALIREQQLETQANLDKVYWMFTRFTYSALASGETLKQIQMEPVFEKYLQHCFGALTCKQLILTKILQSKRSFLILLLVWLMRFVKYSMPVLFAKIKK